MCIEDIRNSSMEGKVSVVNQMKVAQELGWEKSRKNIGEIIKKDLALNYLFINEI